VNFRGGKVGYLRIPALNQLATDDSDQNAKALIDDLAADARFKKMTKRALVQPLSP
jgi:hypothetical protein